MARATTPRAYRAPTAVAATNPAPAARVREDDGGVECRERLGGSSTHVDAGRQGAISCCRAGAARPAPDRSASMVDDV